MKKSNLILSILYLLIISCSNNGELNDELLIGTWFPEGHKGIYLDGTENYESFNNTCFSENRWVFNSDNELTIVSFDGNNSNCEKIGDESLFWERLDETNIEIKGTDKESLDFEYIFKVEFTNEGLMKIYTPNETDSNGVEYKVSYQLFKRVE